MKKDGPAKLGGKASNKHLLTEQEEKYYKDNQTLILQVEALQVSPLIQTIVCVINTV